jgi:hypothetical protein
MLWQACWPELINLPTPEQEDYISNSVWKIAALFHNLGKGKIEDPDLWLKGFITKVCGGKWPPADQRLWQKICGALRLYREELMKQWRETNQRTPAQNRKLHAIIKNTLEGDRTVVDILLAKYFPHATKRDKGGNLVPSTAALTRAEMAQLLTMLEKPGYVPPRREMR